MYYYRAIIVHAIGWFNVFNGYSIGLQFASSNYYWYSVLVLDDSYAKSHVVR